MIRRRLGGIAVVSITVALGCGSTAETRGVPAGIRPEDATFAYYTVDAAHSRLAIGLSRTSLCNRSAIPSGTEYVTVSVDFALGGQPKPGTYAVDTGSANVTLGKTSGDACGGSVGEGSTRGTVVITTLTKDGVEGSFDSMNPDTNIHLKGTFIAKPCPDPTSQCLLP